MVEESYTVRPEHHSCKLYLFGTRDTETLCVSVNPFYSIRVFIEIVL